MVVRVNTAMHTTPLPLNFVQVSLIDVRHTLRGARGVNERLPFPQIHSSWLIACSWDVC